VRGLFGRIGMSAGLVAARPKPWDFPVLMVFVVGGISAPEVREVGRDSRALVFLAVRPVKCIHTCARPIRGTFIMIVRLLCYYVPYMRISNAYQITLLASKRSICAALHLLLSFLLLRLLPSLPLILEP
jgi:hypothetical protein